MIYDVLMKGEHHMSEPNGNLFHTFSESMADAVEKAGAYTVLVDARRRFPASGIAYGPDLVLTADHVVEREDDIRILLPGGGEASASLAGRDAGSDLALLRLSQPGQGLSAAPLGVEARVGQLVLALGRPSPEGIQASLGVVSAVGGPVRTHRGGLLDRYLRTDAIPYPGFSGGPLVDGAGQVVGLNTSGLARGMSLTIPASLAWQVAGTIAQHGHIRRGYLGIRSQPVEISAAQRQALQREQPAGLLIIWLEENGPAEKGGLLVGDILTSINGSPVSDPDELLARLVGSIVGQAVPVQVLRGGQPVTISVTIGERK
jgi:S1-C subfamily serine protease